MPERTGDDEDRVVHGGELPEDDDNSLDEIVVDPPENVGIDGIHGATGSTGDVIGNFSLQVPEGTIASLTSRAPKVPIGATNYVVPGHFDLNRYGELEMQFQKLGIRYFKQDVYPAFLIRQNLDKALLAVYDSKWGERWAFEDYLVQHGLVGSQIMIAAKLQTMEDKKVIRYDLIYLANVDGLGPQRILLPDIHSHDKEIVKSRVVVGYSNNTISELRDNIRTHQNFLLSNIGLEKIRLRIPRGFPTEKEYGDEPAEYVNLSTKEMEEFKGTPDTQSGMIGNIVVSVI